jgi:hypothetical protein
MGPSTTISRHDSWPERQAALHGLLRAQQEVMRDKRRSLRQTPLLETIVGADDEERATQELEAGLDIALLETQSRQVREIETAAPARSDRALFGPARRPGSRRRGPAAVPVTRPLSYGGVSL